MFFAFIVAVTFFIAVTVTLTVTNFYGSNSITKVIQVLSRGRVFLEDGASSLLMENGETLRLG